MYKKAAYLVVITLLGLMLALVTSCAKEGEVVGTQPEEKGDTFDQEGELVIALWDNNTMELYDKLDLEGRFQKQYPNVTLEYEKVKDDPEYWKVMEMRAAAGQLPDLMFQKAFTLAKFQEDLMDLSELTAAENNKAAFSYMVNDKVLGIPEKMTREYVFYWKDLFREAGVEVPDTWGEYLEAAKKLQRYYSGSKSDFAAISLGGKDAWTTYPYMEFMPSLISGNGQNWDTMAKEEEPFRKGTDVYQAYQKTAELFQSHVFGKDPLGIGSDQATAMFAKKQSAMIVLGSWGLTNIRKNTKDMSELGCFYLPVRESEMQVFRTITQGDCFLSVNMQTRYPKLAKAFVEFYFSEAWYPDYIAAITDESSVIPLSKEKDPVFLEADQLQPNAQMILYYGGGDAFTALEEDADFNYKQLGAQMLVQNFELDQALKELNQRWKKSRKELGIS